MIQSDLLHNDQDSSDSAVVYDLLTSQVGGLMHALHSLHRPFGRRAVRSYLHSIKLQRNTLLSRAERPQDDGPFDTRPPG